MLGGLSSSMMFLIGYGVFEDPEAIHRNTVLALGSVFRLLYDHCSLPSHWHLKRPSTEVNNGKPQEQELIELVAERYLSVSAVGKEDTSATLSRALVIIEEHQSGIKQLFVGYDDAFENLSHRVKLASEGKRPFCRKVRPPWDLCPGEEQHVSQS